jgi:hypothetical protein
MKKRNKKNLVVFSLMFLSATCLNAQSSMVATGGELLGGEGSASISVGQVNYQTMNGSNGTSSGGVQQAIEVSSISIQDVPFKNVSKYSNTKDIIAIKVYPNPTTENVNIEAEDYKGEVLSYRLLDITGKALIDEKMLSPIVTVSLSSFPAATYFMEVKQGERASVYKLIKSDK